MKKLILGSLLFVITSSYCLFESFKQTRDIISKLQNLISHNTSYDDINCNSYKLCELYDAAKSADLQLRLGRSLRFFDHQEFLNNEEKAIELEKELVKEFYELGFCDESGKLHTKVAKVIRSALFIIRKGILPIRISINPISKFKLYSKALVSVR